MVTATEEQQARDFLKRAEIRTMKKDLRALREKDALKERDKIAKLKTLEEQLDELKIKRESEKAQDKAQKLRDILQKSNREERGAEKELKGYATEQERQQIFLLESQRLSLEKQADNIDKEKIPTLKLEKNKLDIQTKNLQEKLKPLADQENKLEAEQDVVAKNARETSVPEQRKSLEQRRWEIDKEIQEVEKKRWAIEKQIQETEEKIKQVDKLSEQLIAEKNSLQDKSLGADKSLREIYSGVIARVENTRLGETKEQKARIEVLQKTRAEQKEAIQREQWRGIPVPSKKGFLNEAPEKFKQKMAESAKREEEQRKKFLEDVQNASQNK